MLVLCCVYVCVCLRVFECVCVYVFVCMHVCVCVWIGSYQQERCQRWSTQQLRLLDSVDRALKRRVTLLPSALCPLFSPALSLFPVPLHVLLILFLLL